VPQKHYTLILPRNFTAPKEISLYEIVIEIGKNLFSYFSKSERNKLIDFAPEAARVLFTKPLQYALKRKNFKHSTCNGITSIHFQEHFRLCCFQSRNAVKKNSTG